MGGGERMEGRSPKREARRRCYLRTEALVPDEPHPGSRQKAWLILGLCAAGRCATVMSSWALR